MLNFFPAQYSLAFSFECAHFHDYRESCLIKVHFIINLLLLHFLCFIFYESKYMDIIEI